MLETVRVGCNVFGLLRCLVLLLGLALWRRASPLCLTLHLIIELHVIIRRILDKVLQL
jgi:hypothetical protein